MLLRAKKQTVAFHRGWDLEAEAGNDMIIFLSLFRQVGSWGWLTGHVGRQRHWECTNGLKPLSFPKKSLAIREALFLSRSVFAKFIRSLI